MDKFQLADVSYFAQENQYRKAVDIKSQRYHPQQRCFEKSDLKIPCGLWGREKGI